MNRFLFFSFFLLSIVSRTNASAKTEEPDCTYYSTQALDTFTGSAWDKSFSSDNKYALADNRVIDLETKKIKKKLDGTAAKFSPDGKKIFFLPNRKNKSDPNTLKILDLATDQEESYTLPSAALQSAYRIFSDGNRIVIPYSDGNLHLLDLKTHQDQDLGRGLLEVSPDERRISLGDDQKKTVTLWDLKTSQQEVFKNSTQPSFSPDGQKLLLRGETSETSQMIDLNQRKNDRKFSGLAGPFSPNGKNLLINDMGSGRASTFDLATGQQHNIPGVRLGISWSDENKILGMNYTGNLMSGSISSFQYKLYNTQTRQSTPLSIDDAIRLNRKKTTIAAEDPMGRVLSLKKNGTQRILTGSSFDESPEVSPDEKWLLGGKPLQLFAVNQDCISPLLKIASTDCCTVRKTAELTPDSTSKWIQDFVIHDACTTAYDPSLWPKDVVPQPGSMTEEQALQYLLQFQKPGSIDPKKHLQVLLAVFGSNLVDRHPNLIMGCLQNLASRHTSLYLELMADFPKLYEVKGNPGICRTPNEQAVFDQAANDLLKERMGEMNKEHPNNGFLHWLPLLPFRNTFSQLSPEKKEEYADLIAESIRNSAMDGGNVSDKNRIKGIFSSKVYWMIKKNVDEKFFNAPHSRLTDVTLVRTEEETTPLLLGLDPIDGDRSTLNPYGFYSKKLKNLNPPKSIQSDTVFFNQRLKWTQGTDQFETQFKITVKFVPGGFVSEEKSPRYKELWQDGELNGLIIAGSNTQKEEAGSNLMDNYLYYYQKQGFEFPETSQPQGVGFRDAFQMQSIPDLKKFLKNQISLGSTDYFIKEAHSDGDEKNLFRIDNTAKLIEGTRKLPDGRVEKIRLVFPVQGEANSTLIPNQEFGEWVRQREKDKKGQLIYLNTSCHSSTKSIYEIENARSKTLVNIPTTTGARVFRAIDKDPLTVLLSGIRGGETYQQMRDQMKQDKRYAEGKGDVYIMPDEDQYKKVVTDLLKNPIEIDSKIRDSKGKEYNFESALQNH